MPVPPLPPRNPAPNPQHLSPRLAELQQLLNNLAETERMTRLVDYLHDLQKEFDAVAAELKAMGFCAPCYLSELDDGDDHDCVDAD